MCRQQAPAEGVTVVKLCAAIKVSNPGKQADMLALLAEADLRSTLLSKVRCPAAFHCVATFVA